MIRDILEFPVAELDNKIGLEVGLLVEQIIKLNEEFKTARLPDKIEHLKLRIEHTDNRINQLVYQLYDLTEDEIKIMEENEN